MDKDEPCPCGGSRHQNCGILVAGLPATREEFFQAVRAWDRSLKLFVAGRPATRKELKIVIAAAAEAENSAAK